jgi:GTP-binding protein Era
VTNVSNDIPAGYVGLAGPTNSGKSSLLNALSGRQISPVTGFPGTTRLPLTGISITGRAQICFVDTPPLEKESDLDIFRWMDVLCLVLDSRKLNEQIEEEHVHELLDRVDCPVVLALTFVDYYPETLRTALNFQASTLKLVSSVITVCPPRGDGIAALKKSITSLLPLRQKIFPEDCTTLHSERFLVSEQIRKELFNILPIDVAARTAVQIEEFSFRDGKTYVRANLHVARHLSKGIVIGKRGQTLARIVLAASASSQNLLSKQVHLDLWVKVRESWPDNPRDLLEFGYVC